MSTGISEIGSHPKDEERLNHHILWMTAINDRFVYYRVYSGILAYSGKLVGATDPPPMSEPIERLRHWRRSKTIVASAAFLLSSI